MEQFKNAQIIMLPTENESRIHMLNEGVLYQSVGAFIQADKINYQSQHLYIISEDEIKEGDWYIREFDNTICKANINSDHKQYDCKKIIATTDTSLQLDCPFYGMNEDNIFPQPSQEWIEYYINEYNKGKVITDVLVELKSSNLHFFSGDLRVTPDNTISIKSAKDSWNREEVKILLQKILLDKPKLEGLMMTCWENEWIEQNL